ncbi:MAG: V-type ATPase 116kDa subunit family protein [Deltaproteobacteria bacterium]|nr:V-type ATPase 116kDa subunit family protein [Deltaproteobacteria bacterium]
MMAILYVILGLAIGIGLAFMYLQERLIRERRLTVTMGESERLKSAMMIKDIEEQCAKACAQYQEDIDGYKGRIESLNAECQQRLTRLEATVQDKDARLNELAENNSELQESLVSRQDEIKELRGELTFFKGEAARFEDRGMLAVDDDSIVLAESGHLLPGSVVRSLMKSGR